MFRIFVDEKMMEESFKTFIGSHSLFSPHHRILLAVSGGVDSAVMCHLFMKAGFEFGIAHCNFQLRGEESDGDELFVENLSAGLNVPFFSERFETLKVAGQEKYSIQMAARELRYDWFEKIRHENDFDFIATGHHLNDSLETILINMIRGTGLSGYHGILPVQNRIVRPLLFATSEQIEAYAAEQHINFRVDSSNLNDKYLRNKIRHHIYPVLKEINPSVAQTFAGNASRITEYEKLVADRVLTVFTECTIERNGEWLIEIEKIRNLPNINLLLTEYLREFGFNASQAAGVIEALDGIPGKQFFSARYRLIKDREFLIINGIEEEQGDIYFIHDNAIETDYPGGKLKISKKGVPESPDVSRLTALMDIERLEFPLVLRKWEHGDYFHPIGMKGKKKLSDFLIDLKLPVSEKEKVWVVTSSGKIVWVVGYRLDDRVKITPDTKEVLKLEVFKD